MSYMSRHRSASSPEPADVRATPSREELAALRRENAQLHEAMASRAAIEQAKGMLMLGYALRADQAFSVLSRWSHADQVKVRVLAERLTGSAASSLSGTAPTDTPARTTSRIRPRPPVVAPLEGLMGA